MPHLWLPSLWQDELLPEDLAVYRHLHANPELSGQENETSRLIAKTLNDLDMEVFRCGGAGVVGVLRNGDGPTVAFRADTDALPLEEKTGLSYASEASSQADGIKTPVMHACGHDVHITAGLAAARLLAQNRHAWSGTVVWIFQPAEETGRGALAMVNDGLWDRAPRPSVILAQHVRAIASDQILIGTREIMNLGDSWRVTLTGRGAHGSAPEASIDPILLASHTIVRLQTIVSREVAASLPVVLTVGTFHAGTKDNIIPSEATISLNIRTPDDRTRQDVLTKIRRTLRGEALASGAPEPVVEEISRFPRCYNDPDETNIVARALEQEFGSDKVDRSFRAAGSEDVGWLADSIGVPLVFWFFGAYDPSREDIQSLPKNHSSHFAPDANFSIPAGIRAALSALSIQLRKKGAICEEN